MGLRELHIPERVGELYPKCFSESRSLSHVTFGGSSTLERISIDVFSCSEPNEIHLPNHVRDITRNPVKSCPTHFHRMTSCSTSFLFEVSSSRLNHVSSKAIECNRESCCELSLARSGQYGFDNLMRSMNLVVRQEVLFP